MHGFLLRYFRICQHHVVTFDKILAFQQETTSFRFSCKYGWKTYFFKFLYSSNQLNVVILGILILMWCFCMTGHWWERNKVINKFEAVRSVCIYFIGSSRLSLQSFCVLFLTIPSQFRTFSWCVFCVFLSGPQGCSLFRCKFCTFYWQFRAVNLVAICMFFLPDQPDF